MRSIILLLFLSTTSLAFSQNKAETQVISLLEQQAIDWSNGDIDKFMEGYWKSEELSFIGSSGLTRGWKKTRDNYKKGYPDKKTMGTLSFDLLEVKQQSRKVVTVIGRFILDRDKKENSTGHFLLVVKKIKGKWYVIQDHTSV